MDIQRKDALKQHIPIYQNLLSILHCPDCHKGDLQQKNSNLTCNYCNAVFPLVAHRPVLLRHNNDLFDIKEYLNSAQPEKNTSEKWHNFIPTPSVNLASTKILGKLRQILDKQDQALILVVGGGKQRIWLDSLLKIKKPHQVIYSDIDSKADVDLFCDGHDLPFADSIFDAVITTAVLEHVMYPERVASEITRVLKSDGLLYSELPFMQQVHEGAYDFTRYTLSGHRRLFNYFIELDSGMVAGPGTALAWAIENFFLAFVSSLILRKITKILARLLFSWVKYFDYILSHRPEAMDGASCTYFLGYKSDTPVPNYQIIAHYVGAKHLRHT